MAALVKKVRHIPLIYNLQDIFPDSLVGTGLAKKGGLLWKIGRVIEDFTYRNADKIIVISEDFKRNIMAKGVPEEKIEVIYNWVDEEAVVDVPRAENKLFDKYGLDRDDFYVTYNGNIGLTQNMDMLLEVARELQQSCGSDAALQQLGAVKNGLNSSDSSEPLQTPHNPSEPLQTPHHRSIHFVLVGEGAYKAEVEKRIKEQGITNVTMLPFQPYEDISHVFSLGDVSLVISKPGVGANSVPSKTWSIMSASRPVLANFDENELKAIIEDHHCGIFTKAGDKEAFKAAILELYHHPELCREYGKNGRQFVMDNLTKEVGTRKYVEVVKAVAEHSSSKS
jgi:glycosyltransferase involved in cell wall biosynthesis